MRVGGPRETARNGVGELTELRTANGEKPYSPFAIKSLNAAITFP